MEWKTFYYIAAWAATIITTAIVVDLIYLAPEREAKRLEKEKLLKQLEDQKKKGI